jgi:hypothetical protein
MSFAIKLKNISFVLFSLVSSYDPHPDPPLFKGREPQACEANPVELGSTQFPPLKKGRVRVGILLK